MQSFDFESPSSREEVSSKCTENMKNTWAQACRNSGLRESLLKNPVGD